MARMVMFAWLGVLLLACAPAVSMAQTTGGASSDLIIQPNSGDVSGGYARDNVKGGDVAGRSPGLRIRNALSRGLTYQDVSLKQFGGATITSGEETPNLRQTFLAEFFTKLFDRLTLYVETLSLLGT